MVIKPDQKCSMTKEDKTQDHVDILKIGNMKLVH